MNVRQADSEDLDALVQLDEVARRDRRRVDGLAQAIADAQCYLCEDGSEVVGYGVLEYSWYECGFIRLLYVARPHRRRAVASTLLHVMEERCTTPKLFTSTNRANAPMRALLAKHGYAEFGSVPGERIRREIREANRQVKKLASGKLPALLVIFNNTECFLHTDPYGVMTAMMGIDEVQVSVPASPSQSPTFGPTISGKEKGMRSDANTTLSAVAVLRGYEYDGDSLSLDVFHNRFAPCSLDLNTLRLPRCRQFRIPSNATNSLGGWEEV
jgi:N-acetylglutamate synthase-like GNAT family acetyltransferase